MSQLLEKDAAQIVDLDALPPSALLTRKQLSEICSLHLQTLKRWDAEGKGPRITRLSTRVRYRVADVVAWMEGQNG